MEIKEEQMSDELREINNNFPYGNADQVVATQARPSNNEINLNEQNVNAILVEKLNEVVDLLKEIKTLIKPQEDRADVVVGNASDNRMGLFEKLNKLLSMKFSKDEIKDVRGWLFGGAVMLASVTYSAALNPPGGSWSINNANYTAGEPIFRDMHQLCFFIFYYSDVIAFAGAFTLIFLAVMLTKEKFNNKLLRNGGALLTVCGMAVCVALLFGSNVGGPWWSISPAIFIIVVCIPSLLYFLVLKDEGII